MDGRGRYEMLQSEEAGEMEAREPVTEAAVDANQCHGNSYQATTNTGVPPLKPLDTMPTSPPGYDIATTLPSYEEAERTKEEELRHQEERQQHRQVLESHGPDQLGTDGMFLCTFIIAFLFNWIGLLIAMCLTSTVAGRFGALAGFGLSLVKWVAIVKHNWAGELAASDSWLWWLLIIFGFLIFFRGCIQYIRLRYMWERLNPGQRERVYLYF